jgi:4-amino-4-deoxy-L-arabinose transferase-like glycosyltransferase
MVTEAALTESQNAWAGSGSTSATNRAQRRPAHARNSFGGGNRLGVGLLLSTAVLSWTVLCVSRAYTPDPSAAWPTIRSSLSWLGTAFTHVPRNTGTFLMVVLVTLAMVGPGVLILRLFGVRSLEAWEKLVVGICVGLAGWVPLVLFVGWAIGLTRTDILVPTLLYLSPTVVFGFKGFGRLLNSGGVRHRDVRPLPWVNILLVAVGICVLYLALLGALLPEVSYDARWYHLGSAVHYAEVGHFYNIVASTHDPAMGLNPYQEITYTGFVAMIGVHAAKIFAFVDFALIFVAIIIFARAHLRSARIGIFAALAFICIPVASWSATTASNDLPVALYTLLAVHGLLHWMSDPRKWGWLYVAGALAAFSWGVKAFGLFTLVLVFVTAIVVMLTSADLRRRDSILKFAVLMLVSALTCAPWWIRSGAATGNPIFPLANGVFHSQYWNVYAGKAQAIGARQVTILGIPVGLALALWTTVTDPVPFRTLVGPFFLVALPVSALLAICTRTRVPREVVFLGAFVVLWAAGWYMSGVTDSRYLLGIAPVACLLVSWCVAQAFAHPRFTLVLPAVSMSILVALSLSTLQPLVPLERTTSTSVVNGQAFYDWQYLFRGAAEGTVQLDNLPLARYVNAHLNHRTTKIYDDGAGLNSAYMYYDVEFYNGWGYGSPGVMHQWYLSSPNAYTILRQHGVNYLAEPSTGLRGLRELPVARHLQLVYRSPNGILLFRLVSDKETASVG